jgi:hypothetical protein
MSLHRWRRAGMVAAFAIAGVVVSGCGFGVAKAPSAITDGGATLLGNVTSNQHGDATWWFQYGATTKYGTSTPHRTIAIDDATAHPVFERVEGLAASTTYHVRLCAQDGEPGTGPGCGPDVAFATHAPEDSVAGYGSVSSGPAFFGTIEADAHSDPDGGHPGGTVVGTTKFGQQFGGAVTCLRIDGTRATIGTADFFFFLQDNGGGATDTYGEAPAGGSPGTCPAFPTDPAQETIGAPGITVRDAAP